MNANSNEAIEVLKQENMQLRQLVSQLQTDQQVDRQRIKVLDEELSLCMKYLQALYVPSYTKEELEEWAQEMANLGDEIPPDYLPLSEFIGELERLAYGKAS